MLPFDLQNGLTLEDTGLVLRWCDQRDTLTKSTDYWQRSGDALILVWRSRLMFGGLSGNVTTKLADATSAMPRGFMLGLSFGDRAAQALSMAYKELQSALVTRFGRPQERHDSDDSAEAIWRLDATQGQAFVLYHSHESFRRYGGRGSPVQRRSKFSR